MLKIRLEQNMKRSICEVSIDDQKNKKMKSGNPFQKIEVVQMRSELLQWYDENCRDMPWRRPPMNWRKDILCEDKAVQQQHAYRVWVSEVMLQQTQVSTVIHYFNKWMDNWPTIQALSKATQEQVNEVWAGLGYYRRAKYLLQGCQHVVNNLSGEFPSSKQELKKIPGIGPYTAGAVASIAFGQLETAVDGNVNRVASRLATVKGDPKCCEFVKDIEDFVSGMICDERPGDFNQALMELGATICKPSNPKCSECPLQSNCRAFGSNQVDSFPQKGAQVKRREEYILVSIIQIIQSSHDLNQDLFIMVQRKEDGLLGGLWEWPSIQIQDKENQFNEKNRQLMKNYLFEDLDINLEEGFETLSYAYISDRTHNFSHIKQIQVITSIQLQLTSGENWIKKAINNPVKIKKSQQKVKLVDREKLKSGLTAGVRKAYEHFLLSETSNKLSRHRR
eukprot:TRINITY_DN8532_c0_g1_i4.p1 TRINITY_DN8532_c0_g1~~TRINITY_DN8532_c0_g1_i4.p1  ORF type:complete len:449 (-),score=60.52 TRINITY_DN8532_c0_g1_i4:447-1793(-)